MAVRIELHYVRAAIYGHEEFDAGVAGDEKCLMNRPQVENPEQEAGMTATCNAAGLLSPKSDVCWVVMFTVFPMREH